MFRKRNFIQEALLQIANIKPKSVQEAAKDPVEIKGKKVDAHNKPKKTDLKEGDKVQRKTISVKGKDQTEIKGKKVDAHNKPKKGDVKDGSKVNRAKKESVSKMESNFNPRDPGMSWLPTLWGDTNEKDIYAVAVCFDDTEEQLWSENDKKFTVNMYAAEEDMNHGGEVEHFATLQEALNFLEERQVAFDDVSLNEFKEFVQTHGGDLGVSPAPIPGEGEPAEEPFEEPIQEEDEFDNVPDESLEVVESDVKPMDFGTKAYDTHHDQYIVVLDSWKMEPGDFEPGQQQFDINVKVVNKKGEIYTVPQEFLDEVTDDTRVNEAEEKDPEEGEEEPIPLTSETLAEEAHTILTEQAASFKDLDLHTALEKLIAEAVYSLDPELVEQLESAVEAYIQSEAGEDEGFEDKEDYENKE